MSARNDKNMLQLVESGAAIFFTPQEIAEVRLYSEIARRAQPMRFDPEKIVALDTVRKQAE